MVLLALAIAGCSQGNSGPTSPSPGVAVPTLLTPDDNAYFRQNDPATGCRQDPVWGYGFRIVFTWTPVSNATAYRIHMMHPDASAPLVDEMVAEPQFELRRCTTVVGSEDNWKWKVRAVGARGTESTWSTVRTLNFTQCRIGDVPCGDQSLREGAGRIE